MALLVSYLTNLYGLILKIHHRKHRSNLKNEINKYRALNSLTFFCIVINSIINFLLKLTYDLTLFYTAFYQILIKNTLSRESTNIAIYLNSAENLFFKSYTIKKVKISIKRKYIKASSIECNFSSTLLKFISN